MPYWIAGNGAVADCSGWAVVKETSGTLETLGCHQYKQDAIDQAIAISLSEGDSSLFKGEYGKRAADGEPVIICDIDDTLIRDGKRVEKVYAYVHELEGELILVTGRAESQRAATEKELDDLDIDYDALIMNDGSTANSNAFKKLAAEKLLETYDVVLAVENNPDARKAYSALGIDAMSPADVPDVPAVDLDEEQKDNGMNRFRLIAESLKHKLEGETRSKKLETRTQTTQFEIRAAEENGMSFTGYAAMFNSPSEDLGGFREFVAQGAFKRSLESRNRMMLLWNHDSSQPLASTRNGSLKLTEDTNGLFVEATLPNTQLGRDVAELIRTGTIDAMSFGFQVKKDSWSPDGRTRTLQDVSLHEVSLVSYPAYEGTAGSTAVRNYAIVAERMEIDAEALANAMFKFEQGEKLATDEAQVIRDVLQKLADDPEPEASPEMLTIKKKQFELLLKTLTD